MDLKLRFKRLIVKILFPKSEPDKELAFLKEAYYFWKLTSKYNASHHTDDDIEKMQYTLLRENHVIEKGMSMRNPKLGFGQEKVRALIKRLGKYYNLYGLDDLDFLKYPLSTIQSYIEYTKGNGVMIDDIETEFRTLVGRVEISLGDIKSGVKTVLKREVLASCNKDFKSLLQSRHSIRYFSKEPVDIYLIEEALKLASLTPSACNRQGWKTYVFRGERCLSLMHWQGGCRGFEEELHQAILVTANLKAFLSYEVHQAYVDGGLYAMNLINALHSLGLGCIPLSCGFSYEKLEKLHEFEIPENEIPIVIIGFGHMLDEFRIAESSRKKIERTNMFVNNF